MLPNAQLAFAQENLEFSVRAFSVKDGLSQPFDAYVTAGCVAADLDLATIVGHPAALRIATGRPDQPFAVWSGIVAEMEQVSIEEEGLSIYALRIVPMLWRCKQRRNHRVFQHLSTPEIVRDLLAEWGIAVVFRLDEARFPRHEYRVQFGESDFAFFSRLLEEEGISYLLEQVDPTGNEKDEDEPPEEQELPSMHLVLTELPAQTGRRFETPFPYKGHTEDLHGDIPWITKVRIGRSVRAGRFTVGSYDYRSSPELKLLSEARAGYELEERYEHYCYIPGAFLAEPRPDDEDPSKTDDRFRGPGAQVDEELGQRQARVGLERLRSRQRQLVMSTNQLVLAPGTIFAMECHPRAELGEDTPLLAIRRQIDGAHDGEWGVELTAIFGADPYRPEHVTPKPRVMGVQNALVVGPDGEEIYCDELGRVRVQFFWDRYGQHDQNASCWIRASQGWAGSGYGMHAIPRIGHEVLVDFVDGDPDHPVIVGRAHNRGASPPDQLPRDKTLTSWRSSSTPGGEGYNEISMRDARGEERLLFRAEKDLEKIVLNNEVQAVGADLTTTVRGNQSHNVGRNQEQKVAGDRTDQVDGNFSMRGERGLSVQAGRTTGLSCVDGKLVLSNGQASIVFDGPDIYIDAEANVAVRAGRLASINGKQVDIEGRPEVYINAGNFLAPDVTKLATAMHAGEGGTLGDGQTGTTAHGGNGSPQAPGGMEEAEFDGKGHLLHLINEQLGTKLKWPKAVKLPPEWDDQLERLGRIAYKGEVVGGKLMDPQTWQDMQDRLKRRLDAEQDRLKQLGTDFQNIVAEQGQHYQNSLTRLGDRLSLEKVNLAKLRTDLGDVFSGKHGNFVDSAKALAEIGKEQWKNIKSLKKDLKAMLDTELEKFQEFKEQWNEFGDDVKEVVDSFKNLIDDPKDELLDIVFGEDKELAQDIASLADEFGYGDEVSDFLGLGDGADGADGLVDGVMGSGGGPPPFDPSNPVAGQVPGFSPGPMEYQPSAVGKVNPTTGPMQFEPGGVGKVQGPMGGELGTQYSGGLGRGGMGRGGMGRGGLGGRGALGRGGLGARSGGALGARGGAKGALGGRSLPGGSAGLGPRGGAGSGDLLSQAKAASSGGPDALKAGDNHADFLAQRGGLGASDVAKTVSKDGPAVLQSPGDGQLLVLPNDGVAPVDSAKLQGLMVDAQMQGKPVDSAITSALEGEGYSVYKRSWGDWTGPFVEAGKDAATTV